MGSAIAVPMDRFVLEAAHIERIADTRRWPRDRPVRPLRAFLARIAALPRRLLGRPATKEMQDPWKDAQYRHNQGILSELKCVVSGKQFAVATYHMPCAFYNPTVMVIHAALLLRWAQKHAHRKPLILCGDFNLKPSDAGYHLITGGPTAEVPPAWDGTAFDGSTAYNCKSVFKEVTGKEPDFTNWAHTRRDDEPFIACLDYIFCSPSILVDGVVLLEGRATTATPGPYPTRAEPSDHVMLACDLRIPFVASESVLGKPITRNQDVENLEQYLLEFLADSSKERLDLDASLTSFERLVVHQFCEKEGLGHQSLGQKPTRYISVTKQPHAKP